MSKEDKRTVATGPKKLAPLSPMVLACVNDARAALDTFEKCPNDPYDIWRALCSLAAAIGAVRPKRLRNYWLRRATDECLSWERSR